MNPLAPQALESLLDEAHLRQAWQGLLPGFANGPLRIDALHLAQARRSASHHRHPHPLTLQARLQVCDTASGQCREQVLYGKVFRDGRTAHPGAAELVPPACGPAWAWLAPLQMAVWALPNDPGLPQLPALLNRHTLPAHLPPGHRPAAGGATLEQHTPEVRALLRVPVHGPEGATALYGKTFASLALAQQVQQRQQWAWAATQGQALAPQVPRPLGLDEASHTVWLAAAEHPGLAAAGRLAPPAEGFAAAGRALAWWHAQAGQPGVPSLALPHQGLAHHLAEARHRQKKIHRVGTALDSARASAFLATLERTAAGLPERPAALLHGDFHAGQVALPPHGGCVFFDLDEMALGDPMADLTAFALRLNLGPQPADHARTAFLQGYRSVRPQAWNGLAWHWHVLLQSLQLAARAFVFQRPGWRSELSARLVAAEPSRLALQRELA